MGGWGARTCLLYGECVRVRDDERADVVHGGGGVGHGAGRRWEEVMEGGKGPRSLSPLETIAVLKLWIRV